MDILSDSGKVGATAGRFRRSFSPRWMRKKRSLRSGRNKAFLPELPTIKVLSKKYPTFFWGLTRPSGYQLYGNTPPRCTCLYLADSATSQMQIPFSDIKRIRFEGDRLLVTLKSGEERSGVVRYAVGSPLRPYFDAVRWDGQGRPSAWGAARWDKGRGVDVFEPGAWPIRLVEFAPF